MKYKVVEDYAVREKAMDYKLEYHEGYYAAGNGIPYDEAWSDARKEGYRDGIASLYGDDE